MTSVTFYDSRLSTVLAVADRDFYGSIFASLTAKYGQPCRVMPNKWRNAMGTTLDNPITVWCFKTGELQLEQFGSKIDEMSFFYEDDNQPPAGKPTVDF